MAHRPHKYQKLAEKLLMMMDGAEVQCDDCNPYAARMILDEREEVVERLGFVITRDAYGTIILSKAKLDARQNQASTDEKI